MFILNYAVPESQVRNELLMVFPGVIIPSIPASCDIRSDSTGRLTGSYAILCHSISYLPETFQVEMPVSSLPVLCERFSLGVGNNLWVKLVDDSS